MSRVPTKDGKQTRKKAIQKSKAKVPVLRTAGIELKKGIPKTLDTSREKLVEREGRKQRSMDGTDRKPKLLRVSGEKTIKSPISFTKDVKAALEKAAKAERTSASVIVNEALAADPRIQKYLPLEELDI